MASIEKHEGNWNWVLVGEAECELKSRELQFSVPRSLAGLGTGKNKLSLNFKWADNVRNPGDIMDFYVNGDVAPEGRFMYRYEAP